METARVSEGVSVGQRQSAATGAEAPNERSGRQAAFFAAWFLAIAGMLNGILHPLLAITSGGYFPGLVTSPFIALASALVWIRLHAATLPSSFSQGPYAAE